MFQKIKIQKPAVQQGSQATTTSTTSNAANNTTNLVVKDQAELQGAKNNTVTVELQDAVTFTGIVKETENKQVAEETLAPKSRESVEYWREEHQEHIKELKKKQANCILLGDSIIKHVTRSNISKKIEWESAKIANFGINGDRVENILCRLQSYPVVKEIKKIVIAIGTNNFFTDSAKLIESTIAAVQTLAREKIPAADVWMHFYIGRRLP